jgi:hypothetical protein
VLDLEADFDYWQSRARLNPSLTYDRHGAPPLHLIRPAAEDSGQALIPFDPQAWRLPNSLRNVEREHNWFRK